jgi:phosphoglycerate dehydrogenase-like enzyme
MTEIVTVCVPLSLDPTAAIEAAAQAGGHRVEVRYRPDLLPPQRFVSDHRGTDGFARSAVAEAQWQRLLVDTTMAFGIPGDNPAGLARLTRLAPGLTWVQGTAAGAGEQLAAADLPAAVLQRVQVTSAAGVHAVPLAEFAIFGLLALAKDVDLLQEANAAREWRARWPMRLLAGSRVVIVGLGGIGRQTAQLAAAFGATVIGVRRTAVGEVPPGVTRVVALDELAGILPEADAVIVTLPGTAQTRGLFDSALLKLLPPHAALVNVGRGSVVDTGALVAALDAGSLRGAVLDVVDTEPLPAESPLWNRPNVILSPHTAAMTIDEDDRLTALFADNLGRLLNGRPLRNLVDLNAGY